eukprot:3223133-Alexandrium_andersonii.AAC.1
MSASLVGSEMCIRDRSSSVELAAQFKFEPLMDLSEEAAQSPHAKSRFYLHAAPGAPINPGASAYDSA